MSILFEDDSGTFLCSETYFNSLTESKINPELFRIYSPYSTRNSPKNKLSETSEVNSEFEKEVKIVRNAYFRLLDVLHDKKLIKKAEGQPIKNTEALNTAFSIYDRCTETEIKDITGGNFGPATVRQLSGSRYVFPENCQFFCKDVNAISNELQDKQFDLILLDPPWWNKYIRRKRKKSTHAYDMMFNCDLMNIPIRTLLSDSGLVAVWCTNSMQHLNYLTQEIFPKWNVSFLAKWYWVKVTVHGEPICSFSKPPGKQPFEQILLAHKCGTTPKQMPLNGRLLVSVPSAIHSHKPPLTQVLQPLLPDQPRCLEIFARYLLPNWTSYGNEVLKLQHESLYVLQDEQQ